MHESGEPSERLGQEEPASGRELLLNLRRSQARFLQLLAAETNLEPSLICQRLIDFAMRPEVDWKHDPVHSAAVRIGSESFPRASGDSSWTKVPIALDDAYFDGLCALATASKASNSNIMRHLLADFMQKAKVHSSRRKSRKFSSRSRPLKSTPYALVSLVAMVAIVSVLLFFSVQDSRSIKVGPHWAGTNASLIFDPHTHTRYSDGRLSPAELVDLAVQGGCDALAISDHSDREGAVSDEQMAELQELRNKYPDLLLFSGIELNMPSYGGREHAGLIADPSVEAGTLQQLRDVAERSRKRAKKAGGGDAFDMQLLQTIADYQSLQNGLLLFYSHPSREDDDIAENLADLKRWNASSHVFAAIEGGPGHQNARVIGKYEEPYLTQNRWDPVVAEVGGVWDQLLADGHMVWGALASSDYHNKSMDKAPCTFSRTHLIVPEWSYRGVLMALRAGTFWADHGRILDQLRLSVEVEGLEQAAYPGYTVYVGDLDSLAEITLAIERGPGSEGLPLSVEFIGNCNSGEAQVMSRQILAPEESTVTALVPLAATGSDGTSCILRARVRLIQESSADYLAYTNPIRLILD